MAKVKIGTIDKCRLCGRSIEWATPPAQFDDEGNEIHTYWKADPRWIDQDPPGEEVWNTYCNYEDRTGRHQPKTHCSEMMQSGDRCYAKVREPIKASDDAELWVCGKHAANALQTYERQVSRADERKMEIWKLQSSDHYVHELQSRRIRNYPLSGAPSWNADALRAVDIEVLMQKIWEYEFEIKDLTELVQKLRKEVEDGRANQGEVEGREGMVHLSV